MRKSEVLTVVTRSIGRSLGLLLLIGAAASSDAKGNDDDITHILMVTESKGFMHGSVNRNGKTYSTAELAMRQLGVKTGLFRVDATQDCEKEFTRENLDRYEIVMFYTTGMLPISSDTLDYFLNDWLKKEGHGFIGFHSATDTYKDYVPYREMINGSFDGHPWGAGSTVTLTVHEPEHPTVKPFGREFTYQDEIYQYSHFHPENVRVLMSLNMAKCETKRPYHVPVAWVRAWGDGKIFYNNLGHREETWSYKPFLDSVTMAVRWIRGDIEGATEPNPIVSQQQADLAQQAAPNQ